MIDEQDLYDLAHEPLSTGGRCRSVGDVVARGQSLRRRRRAMRDFGLASMVGGLVAAGTVVARHRDDGAGVVTASSSASDDDHGEAETWERESPVPVCLNGDEPEADPASAEDVRYLPRWLPEGSEVDSVTVVRSSGNCPAPDPALVLQADGGDDTVEATIYVTGPEDIDFSVYSESRVATEIRGVPAYMDVPSAADPGAGFYWTEPDAGTWVIIGNGTDESTVRAVAEQLVLTNPPPAPILDATAIPAEFELVWQRGNDPEPEDQLVLAADLGERCLLTVVSRGLLAPPWVSLPSERVAVGDAEGVSWFGADGSPAVEWELANGVRASIGCDVDPETLLRIAESVEAVEADDPRLSG